MVFPESALAHRYLDGLSGIEIGGSAHNPFGLDTVNVDYTSDLETVFKKAEREMCGKALPVDLVAPGDELPLENHSVDFVISSHVLEHFPDPIKALKEWWRVIRPGGYIFAIIPHKERTFDKDRSRTPLAELIHRHQTGEGPDPGLGHCSVWITEDVIELARYLGYPVRAVQDTDDKAGNGFAVLLEKPGGSARRKLQRLWGRLPLLRRWSRRALRFLHRPPLCPFFEGQVRGEEGKLYLRFPNGASFGYFSYSHSTWIEHADLGRAYVVPGNDPAHSVYLWDQKSGHWLYTSPATFPYLFDFTWNAWLYYFPDTNTPGRYTRNPRYFANMSTGQILSIEEALSAAASAARR